MKDVNKTKAQLINELEDLRKRTMNLESGKGHHKPAEPEEDVSQKIILVPESDAEELELADVLDVQAIQSLMDNFYELARIPMTITDIKGKVLVDVGWQEICTRFHRVHPETLRHCVESAIRLAAGVPAGESKLYKCRNNMWDVATPIMVGGKHLGNVFSGQFFFDDEPLDYELFRSQARQYGFPEEEYLAALEAVPRLSRESLSTGTAFFIKLAQMFSQLSYSNIKLDRSLAERDSLVNLLQVSDDKYRGIFENAIEGIYRSSPDGSIIEINPAFARVLRYASPEEVKSAVKDIGQQFYVEPEKRREWMREVVKRDYGSFEVQIRRKDGSIGWISNKARVVRNEKGEALYFDGYVEDISEQKRADEDLRKAEEKYRGIFENALEGIYRTAPDGRFLDANPALARIFGYDSPEELMNTVSHVGKQLHLDPEDRQQFISCMDQQGYASYEGAMRKKDGSACWVFFSGRAVRDTEGNTTHYEGFCNDITERKRAEEELKQYRNDLEALVQKRTSQLEEKNRLLISEIAERKWTEEALRESENKYRTIFENTGTATLILDEDTTISLVNAELERLFHYTRDELEGKKSWQDFILKEDFERLMGYHRLRRVGAEAAPKNYEFKVVDRFGCLRDVHVTIAMIPGTKKSVASLLDITQLKEVERALTESEALYRNLFENASIGMFQTSLEGRFLHINKAFATMLGYASPEEVMITITDTATQIHADPRNRAVFLAALEQQDWFYAEQPYLRKDGGTMIGKLAIRRVLKPDGTIAYLEGIVEDITERKKAEAALKKYAEEITDLYENAPCGYHSIGEDGTILRMNNTELSWLGYSHDEVIGKMKLTDLMTSGGIEAFQRDFPLLKKQGWLQNIEDIWFRKDGGVFDIIVNTTAVFDESGNYLMNRCSVFDNTEKKRAEEALLEREKELRIKAQDLQEVNTTMKVLLNTMEKDQEELKERFLTNIKTQVLPYLDKLKKTPLNEVQKGFVKTAEAYLCDIASPFVKKLTSDYLDLTKKEIQIAALIKEGRTSKEIAVLLNSKKRVIDFHRENIRRKFGLNNTKDNLAIFLRSFS